MICRAQSSSGLAIDSKGLVMLATSYSKLKTPVSQQFVDLLSTSARAQIDDFDVSSLIVFGWHIVSSFQTRDVRLVRQISDILSNKDIINLHELSPANMTNAVYVFAKAGVRAPVVFDAVARSLVDDMDKFSLDNISTICWALATENCPPESSETAIAAAAKRLSLQKICARVESGLGDDR